MGTHNFLNKELQQKVEKLKINRSSPVAVDGFNILRIIWSARGYGSKVFLGSSNHLQELAINLSQQMAKYVEEMCPDREEPFHWFFDGNKREMEKLREQKSKKTESKMLNKALHHIFVSTKHDAPAIGKAILNDRFFAHSPFLDCVLATLNALPKHVVLQAFGEADFAIARFCDLNKSTVVVISSDSDYLAFTNCLGVIVPQVDRRSYYSKQQVLDDRGCTAMEQMVAVCFNGQDHVHGVKGYGIARCIKAFHKCKKQLKTLEEHFDYLVQFIKKKSKKKENPVIVAEAADLCKEEGMRLIQMFTEGKIWQDSIPTFDQASRKLAMEKEALYLKFAKEEDENGIPRRPMLRAKLVDGYRNPLPVKKTMTHEEHLMNQRVCRFVEATNAVSKKARSMNFNILEAQSRQVYKFTEKELCSDSDSNDSDSDDSDEEEETEEEEEEAFDVSDKVGDSIPKEKTELHRQMALNQIISRDFGSMHQILLPELVQSKFPEYMSQGIKLIKVNNSIIL